MHFEIECKRCRARYRVKEDMAGRIVQCQRCGQKFPVPARAPVTQLSDEDAVDISELGDEPTRTLEEYGVSRSGSSRAKSETADTPPIPLPHELSAVWLPIVAALAGYGVTIAVGVRHALASPGPTAALVMLGAFFVAYAAVIIPLVLRGLDGASRTFDLVLPNAVRLQTWGACAPLLAGATLGWVSGRIPGMVAGAAVGAVMTFALLVLFFQAAILKVAQAAAFAILLLVLSTGVGVTAILGVGALLLPLWHLNLPWEDRPAQVAAATPTPTEPAARPAEPAPAEPAPTSAPAAPPGIKPAEPAPEQLKWAPATEPPQMVAAALAGSRAPVDLQRVFDVADGSTVLHGAAGSLHFAALDSDSCETYDVRAGRHTGSIGQRFHPSSFRLSPNGKYVVGERMNQISPALYGGRTSASANGSSIFDPDATPIRPATYSRPGANPLEVWSVANSRLVGQIRPAGRDDVVVLGFANPDRMVTTTAGAGDREVLVWDLPSAQVLRTFQGKIGPVGAISVAGRFLASVDTDRLRVYDLDAGTLRGEAILSPANHPGVRAPLTLSFGPDGTALALVAVDTADAVRLIIFNLESGSVEQDVILPGPPAPGAESDLFWVPDGRALFYEGTFFDRKTGKPYWRLEPQTIVGGSARPRAVASNYHVLFEAVAPGKTRLAFKSVALNRHDVDAALRSLRGDDWAGEDLSAAAGHAPTATLLAATGPSTTSPSTRPVTLASVAAKHDWSVTVLLVRHPDLAALDKQIELERSKLKDLEAKFTAARARADALAPRNQRTITVRDPFSGRMSQQSAGPDPIASAASSDARKADNERRAQNGTVLRLERDRQAAETSRTIVARLDDGQPVEINVDGAALSAIADGLDEGSHLKVSGAARIDDGVIRIHPRTLAIEK